MIILPEMAFTGYVFKDKEDIHPYLETNTGVTVQWAIKTAKDKNAFVQVGYPEKVLDDTGAIIHRYNSVVFVTPEGATYHHRKHFLYVADETWAEEGPHFTAWNIEGLGAVCPAICMDFSPYRFEAPFEAYEFATFAAKNKANLILGSMNWLMSPKEEGVTSEDAMRRLYQYWALRLTPCLGTACTVLVCNRVGTEADTTFAGSSVAIDLLRKAVVGAAESQIEESAVYLDVPIYNPVS